MVDLMYEVIRNTSRDGRIEPPRRPDGTRYPYLVVFDSGDRIVFADTFEEICDELIPGYRDAPNDDERRVRLLDYAAARAVVAQARHVASSPHLDDNDKTVALTPRHGPLPIHAWAAPVPLVILDLHYAPHTDTPAPVGVNGSQVIPIITDTPETLLRSLARAGDLDLQAAN